SILSFAWPECIRRPTSNVIVSGIPVSCQPEPASTQCNNREPARGDWPTNARAPPGLFLVPPSPSSQGYWPAGERDVRQKPQPNQSGRRSEAGYVTRHSLPFGGRNRLHDFHHVGIVGPLALGKAVHRLDEIFVALAGQPRPRQTANE